MKILALLLLALLLFSCTIFTAPTRDNPIICFTFDDLHKNVYYLALPAMNQYGYRATCYVNSGSVGAANLLTLPQLGELHMQWDWEIGGHSLNHERLEELSFSEAATAIETDYANLDNWGFEPRSFALPRGVCPLEYYPLITAHYDYIRGSNDNAMHNPLNVHALGYLPFQNGWSAETIKDRIQRGIINGESLIVIGFHRIEENSPNYNANCPIAIFNEILAYVHSLGLEVLPLSEAVDKLK